MFDFIPLSFYTPLYHHIILLVTLLVFIELHLQGYVKHNKLGVALMIFVIIYMGLRPISGAYFGDMGLYARRFSDMAIGEAGVIQKDIMFQYFMLASSKIMSVNTFFLLCAIIYVVPMYLVSKKWFKSAWFYAFLMLVGSFSFWAYGTNGIRNGIASSFFLLAISRDRKIYQILFIAFAISFHKSLILPSVGFIVTWFYNVPKAYFYFWLVTIPLSLVLPGFWENLFATIADDERATSYLVEEDIHGNQFSYVGFRWDFLLYSALGVVAGWYYIFKKNYKDKIYITLFNTFLFANAIWILVIRATFSNRFAYLSWFMLALVIVYPWAKNLFEVRQTDKFKFVLLGYYLFTFVMNVVIYG